jgi:dephospho-CoA kinase
VGIAGIMGAGKSTVAGVFEELGARRIDADVIGRDLLKERDLKSAIIEAFGHGVKDKQGEIDTAKLGKAAFKDEASAKRLSELTREPLVGRIKSRVENLRDSAEMIVIDAALLPEWESKDWVDVLIVVDSGEDESLGRACEDPRFKPANVRARMKHQFSRRRKAGCADIVIPNFGTLEDLKERARRVFWTLMGVSGKGE